MQSDAAGMLAQYPKNTHQIFLPNIFQSGKFQKQKKNLRSPCHLTQE